MINTKFASTLTQAGNLVEPMRTTIPVLRLGARRIDKEPYVAVKGLESLEVRIRADIWLACKILFGMVHVTSSAFLPECDYVTFGSLISQIRLSSVCNFGTPYSRG